MAIMKVSGCVHVKHMCINIWKEGSLQFQKPLINKYKNPLNYNNNNNNKNNSNNYIVLFT